MINTLILQGRLAQDFLNKNGNAYSTLAVDTYKGDTMYIDIVAFKQTAEYCFNYLKKGTSVLVEGSLSISKYQDKKYITCIIKSINSLYGGERVKQVEKPQPQDTNDDVPIDIDDDLLPF